jgi:hypothetical protein
MHACTRLMQLTCVYASLLHAPPTLGAPSCTTQSNLLPFASFFSAVLHAWVVMSCTRVLTPRMGLMGTRSTPRMSEVSGMVLAATCSHPPGAAHRSSSALHPLSRSYFRLSWMSLKAARERYLPSKGGSGEVSEAGEALHACMGPQERRRPPHARLPIAGSAQGLGECSHGCRWCPCEASSPLMAQSRARAAGVSRRDFPRRLTLAPWRGDRTCPDGSFPIWSSSPCC